MNLTPHLGIARLPVGIQQPHIMLNEALEALSKAVAAVHEINLSTGGSVTLTGWESTASILRVTATTAPSTVTVQAAPKLWVFINDGQHPVTVMVAGQSSPPSIAAGAIRLLLCSGATVAVVAT